MDFNSYDLVRKITSFTDKTFTKPFVLRNLLYKYGEFREVTDKEFDTEKEMLVEIEELKELAEWNERAENKWSAIVVTNTGINFSYKEDL